MATFFSSDEESEDFESNPLKCLINTTSQEINVNV